MPRFRPQACVARGAIAALLLALALLSGGCAAATPAEGEKIQPGPFALGLPTPTNTAGVEAPPPVIGSTGTAAPGATPVAAATPTGTATVTQPDVPPTATGTQAAAPSPTATIAPTSASTETATPVPQPDAQATPTPLPATATPTATELPPVSPPATPLPPTETPPAPPSPPATRTRAITVVPASTSTPPPTQTPTPTPALVATATWTPVPTPTWDAPAKWNLARDVIGMWEYATDEGWRYYFDFLPDGRAVIDQNGIRAYQVRGSRTLAIQMPEGEWLLTVLDLTADRMTLEGFIYEAHEFHRVPGTPGLRSKIVGFWLDESGEHPSIEFTSDGRVIGKFGRGTYKVVSDNSVLVTCDRPQDCERYRVYGQGDDTPLVLRMYDVTDDTLTVRGFNYSQQWTLDYRAGIPNLANGLLGRWVNESTSLEFRDNGDLVRDGSIYGRYQVLSGSTFWTRYEGEEQGQTVVVIRLTGTELALAKWGSFYKDDLLIYTRPAP